MGPWDFVAAEEEGSTSEILQKLLDRYPNLDPYRLTYATSTPIDPLHLVRARASRRLGYALVFLASFAIGMLALGFPRRLQRG